MIRYVPYLTHNTMNNYYLKFAVLQNSKIIPALFQTESHQQILPDNEDLIT